MTFIEEKRCDKCQGKLRFMRKHKEMDAYGEESMFEYYKCQNCGRHWRYGPDNIPFPTKAPKAPSPRLRRRSSRRGGIGFSR
jgi:hypothetical protein